MLWASNEAINFVKSSCNMFCYAIKLDTRLGKWCKTASDKNLCIIRITYPIGNSNRVGCKIATKSNTNSENGLMKINGTTLTLVVTLLFRYITE